MLGPRPNGPTCVTPIVDPPLKVHESIKIELPGPVQLANKLWERSSGYNRRWSSGSAKKIRANDPSPPARQCSPPRGRPAASAAAIKISICSQIFFEPIPMLLSRLQSYTRSYQWLDQTKTLFLQLVTPTISLGIIFFMDSFNINPKPSI